MIYLCLFTKAMSTLHKHSHCHSLIFTLEFCKGTFSVIQTVFLEIPVSGWTGH